MDISSVDVEQRCATIDRFFGIGEAYEYAEKHNLLTHRIVGYILEGMENSANDLVDGKGARYLGKFLVQTATLIPALPVVYADATARMFWWGRN